MGASDSGVTGRTFEAKVASLIATTRHLDVPHILVLRRMTMADPQARKWATEKQLNIVFQVILSKALEGLGTAKLLAARAAGLDALLPTGGNGTAEDRKVLTELVEQLIGPLQPPEVQTTQANLRALLARASAPPPPKTARVQLPSREPPPLFAAQLAAVGDGRRGRGAVAQPSGMPDGDDDAHPGRESHFTDFPTLFDDTLYAYVEKVLSIFRVGAPTRGLRVPFLLAPEFGPTYREVMRHHILPQMRSTRAIQTLGQTYNWAEVGGDKLIEIIQGSEVNNPILHNWDGRWAAFRAPKPIKGRKPAPQRPEDNPWQLFREDAVKCNYDAPSESNIVLLQDIIRYEADALAKCWRELGQLYSQEFSPTGRMEQAREGAFRDGIMRWSAKLPDFLGEHMAIKAHFEFERIDMEWLRKLMNSFGRNDSERRRNAPFLSDFLVQSGF